MARHSSLGALGKNGYYGGGGGGGFGRRQMASDITRSVAQMTTGITTAIISARQARRRAPAPAAPAPRGEDLIGGERYGVQARSPWGTIALGGTAVVLIGGLLIYIAASSGSKRTQTAAK